MRWHLGEYMYKISVTRWNLGEHMNKIDVTRSFTRVTCEENLQEKFTTIS